MPSWLRVERDEGGNGVGAAMAAGSHEGKTLFCRWK